MKMLVTAHPYATQYGTIHVPDDTINPEKYIREHWDDIIFKAPDITYYGTDFDYEVDNTFWKDGDEAYIAGYRYVWKDDKFVKV
jgi:hypothetical protein